MVASDIRALVCAASSRAAKASINCFLVCLMLATVPRRTLAVTPTNCCCVSQQAVGIVLGMSTPTVREAIAEAGGISVLATALGFKNPETVRVWLSRGLPDKHVLAVAEQTGWKYTPHQLAPDLYPHPDDGLPEDMRAVKAA